MSLASLQLASLGDPSGALASYERYLAGGGGPLSEQAEYGRIRAMHQLGRSSEEREATRRFIARYPDAPETLLLKKRDGVPRRR
jgi:regulator of sirC expression with transglutaminase-like and TPR domain